MGDDDDDADDQRKHEYAVICKRRVKVHGRSTRGSWLPSLMTTTTTTTSPDQRRHQSASWWWWCRRCCLGNTSFGHESEDEHRRIVTKLCHEGLAVDIVDGGLLDEGKSSGVFILLISAPDELVRVHDMKFRQKLWQDHGSVSDFDIEFSKGHDITRAERIERLDSIIKQGAGLTTEDFWIQNTCFQFIFSGQTSSLLDYRVESFNALCTCNMIMSFGTKLNVKITNTPVSLPCHAP